MQEYSKKLVIYVDVDDTLVRSHAQKQMPMPAMVEQVKQLHAEGAELYCWSSGGGEYARNMAKQLGIEELFVAFMPKPQVMIDDMSVNDWRQLVQVHPNEAVGLSILDYAGKLS